MMGGRTSEVGWFRSRTETYHNDVVSVDFSVGPQWQPQLAQGDIPQSREFHTISAISGGRLLLLGGVVAASKEILETSRVILGQGHAYMHNLDLCHSFHYVQSLPSLPSTELA